MDEAREYLTLLSKRACKAIDDEVAPANSKLVLCSYGEDLRPRVEHFRPGGVSRMVDVVEKWAKEDGRNIYASWCLYAPDLAPGKRGEIQDIVAVLALCADLDNDKGGAKVGLDDLPCRPSTVIETSPGNMQALFVLDRALTAEEAKPVAQGLRGAVPASDSGTGDINHVWRIPGLTNWPKKAKRDRGREPCPSRILQPFTRAIPADELPCGGAKEAAQGDVEREARRVNVEHARREAWVKLKDARNRARKNERWDEVEQYSEALHRMDQPEVYGGLRLISAKKKVVAQVGGEDRSDTYFWHGVALAKVGMTRGEVIALVRDTPHWKDRERDGKTEDPNRLIANIADEAGVRFDEQGEPAISTGFEDPADWAGQSVPQRQWLLEGFVPMKKVTALYGDGGTGKTTLALQLAVSVAAGQPFLGCEVRKGRVLAFLAENDRDDTYITLAAIIGAYELDFDAVRGLVLVDSCAGEDNVLMGFGRDGGATTERFDELLKVALEFEPALIVLDTAADVFEGNENDRGQVRRFMSEVCTRLAIETGAAVVLCAHPSRQGLQEGDGGSTAWSNSARSRLHFKRIRDEDNEIDRDLRVLEVKKSNHGPIGESIKVRWRDNVFFAEEEPSHAARVIQEVERAFDAGNPWSPHARAQGRCIIQWMQKVLGLSKARAQSLLDDLRAREAILFEEYDAKKHKSGLFVPGQRKRN